MRILRLQTQGYKRVTAVDITPAGPLVEIRGNNAEGKSSLLDSIKTALGGAAANPIKPIRTGDDFAAIRLELGDGGPALIVEKYFDEVGEKLRITNAEGDEIKAGQTKVADLLGRMTFDPLAFARLDAEAQAKELRRLVPLEVDFDALARADAADRDTRRDVNREGKSLAARVEAIEVSGVVPPRPDREAIVEAISSAASVNAALDKWRHQRGLMAQEADHDERGASALRGEANELRRRAEDADRRALALETSATAMRDRLLGLPPLREPVDTAQLTADLAQADRDFALLNRIAERTQLESELAALRQRSAAFTTAIAERAEQRRKALAAAPMPIKGLALSRRCDVIPGDESDDLIVMFDGEPFEQASSAQQLRVSMRLAMAANPRLRVMLIKDGSLLDENGLALVRDLAAEGDYQVWLESVGEGDGTGIIMEAGSVRGAPTPEPIAPPRRRRARPLTDAERDDLEDLSKGPRAVPEGLSIDRATGETVMVEDEPPFETAPRFANPPRRTRAAAAEPAAQAGNDDDLFAPRGK